MDATTTRSGPAPRRVPGLTTRALSPAELHELTSIRPPAEDVVGQDFGMVVKELRAIDPKGIRLQGEIFTHPELDLVLSNRGAGRRFLVKYDPVQVARGALEHVLVYEVDQHGVVEFKLEAVNVAFAGELMSKERILSLRKQHEAALLAKRDNAEQELMSLRKGEAATDRLLEDRAMQAQNRGRGVPEPAPEPREDSPKVRARGPGRTSMDVLRKGTGAQSDVSTDAVPDVRGRPPMVERQEPPERRPLSTRDLLPGQPGPQEENGEP